MPGGRQRRVRRIFGLCLRICTVRGGAAAAPAALAVLAALRPDQPLARIAFTPARRTASTTALVIPSGGEERAKGGRPCERQECASSLYVQCGAVPGSSTTMEPKPM